MEQNGVLRVFLTGLLPPPGGTVLCAVSGGADSVCLLHILREKSRQMGFSLVAAHFNHGLRGAESDGDEAFVRRLCDDWLIPCRVGRGPVVRKKGESPEEAARRERYEFLHSAADAVGAAYIATAHTASDNAETALFNLLRGAGGLVGIPPARGRIIRPLLRARRQDVEEYLAAHGIRYVTDSTNADDDITRNYLRHQVLPLLQKCNSGAAENIARAAELSRVERDYLDALAKERLGDMTYEEGGASLPLAALATAPEALRGPMVRQLLEAAGAGRKDVTAAHIGALLSLTIQGTMTSLPGFTAYVNAGRLHLRREAPCLPLVLRPGERGEWHGAAYALAFGREGDLTFALPESGEVTLRRYTGGDTLRLPGSRGRRSLKRLFADNGVPLWERERYPVIEGDGRVLAVWGIGIDEEAAAADDRTAVTIKKEKMGVTQ